MLFKITHEQMLVVYKYIRIQERLKDLCTPHVIRSTVEPRFCKLELAWPRYSPGADEGSQFRGAK